ncbi:MAG: hemolysin family protein [Desulfatiglandaceae bacterium]|jgi:CBS domain containing-hemolysin-like protein
MTQLVLAVGLALFISAVCSLFEAVLYSVPRGHVEAAARTGKKTAILFQKMRGDVQKPIAAVLSLNTIAATAGAAFAGSAAGIVFGHQSLVWFSALFTLSILIFSEIVPKTAGVIYGRSLVPLVAYPLRALIFLMTPVVWLSGMVTGLITRGQVEEAITPEEIRIMARMSLHSGGIRPYQEKAIENILTLQNKTARDVMTPRTVIFSLNEHLTLKEACEMATKWEHSRFPVYDRDQEDVVGIVLTKELFIALSHGREEVGLAELMRPVHFVAETSALNRVLAEFLELRQHLFVVLDEYGGMAGVITLEDILEEILGREIVDESDEVADKRELARKRRDDLVNSVREPEK